MKEELYSGYEVQIVLGVKSFRVSQSLTTCSVVLREFQHFWLCCSDL